MDDIQRALEQAETYEPFEQKPLAAILDDIVNVLQRFVVLPTYRKELIPSGFVVLALWVAHTYTFMYVETTPYLQLWSATMRAGKTTVLEILNELVSKGWLFSDTTVAAMSRKVDKDQPTVLYDEHDTANKELAQELAGLFNSGYKKSGSRTVTVGTPGHFETQDLSQYCPKAFAGIGSETLRETLRDRAIPIELRRKKPSEKVERNRQRTRNLACAPIKVQIEGWADLPGLQNPLSVEVLDIPDQLDDRQQDCWEPLLAIADLAGGEWSQKARSAAITINANRQLLVSHSEMLLSDIRTIFRAHPVDSMFTVTLLSRLHEMEDRPWGSIMAGDKPMNSRSLSGRLKDFNIKPKKVRRGETVLSGYKYEDFAEAFERNLEPWVDTDTEA
jgi:hypothetical protein